MVKSRYLSEYVKELCFPSHKMAFISGPRQCGKTTFAKKLLSERKNGQYFNWDEMGFRKAWTKAPLNIIESTINLNNDDFLTPIVILDEIHKAKSWKRNLKGVFDSIKKPIDIIVTGSAKLNVYRRSSDSLLGRYFHFRLHPFSLAELSEVQMGVSHESLIEFLFSSKAQQSLKKLKLFNTLEQLWLYGPFPEPLFTQKTNILRIWQRERVERLIREDLRDLSRIQELSQIEMLVSLLPERAAGVLSINSLREDLEVAYITMKVWMEYLKQIYYVFEIKPYSKSIPRSLKKEGKLYLWDWSEVESEGAKFENMIACHLLKYTHFLTDTGQANVSLHYLKNKQKEEIDFLLVKNKKPWLPIEIKLTETKPSKNWRTFFNLLPCKFGVQIVRTPGVFKHLTLENGEVLIISAEYFLALLV